jgi:signal transduction histidine kinase
MLAFEENSQHTRSGLGLTVCKQIIGEFGGHIQLSSRVGVGTKVLIQIPFQYNLLEGIENVELTDRRPNSVANYN